MYSYFIDQSSIYADASAYPQPNTSSPIYSKLVLFVIDGFRWDFLTNEPWRSHLPFINSLVSSGQTLTMPAICDPPTVTIARIKALTSGIIPGPRDLLFNLHPDISDPENIIRYFHDRGNTLCCFGDDTWNSLFPTLFDLSDPVSSLFVWNTDEVDLNVTRHIDEIPGCDVTILHYLGLDHLAHIHGTFHPKVMDKMEELDSYFQRVYHLVDPESTLLVLLGDHGLSDAGGHGGASREEITTLFSFVVPEGSTSWLPPVRQIDFAPTISTLFSLPIPPVSLGTLIMPLISKFPSLESWNFTKPKPVPKSSPSILPLILMCISSLGILTMVITSYFTESTQPRWMYFEALVSALIFSVIDTNLVHIISFFFLAQTILLTINTISAAMKSKRIQRPKIYLFDVWTVFFSVIPSFALASSSFIEEQHFSLYHVLLLGLVIQFLRRPQRKLLLLMVLLRVFRYWNTSGDRFYGDGDICKGIVGLGIESWFLQGSIIILGAFLGLKSESALDKLFFLIHTFSPNNFGLRSFLSLSHYLSTRNTTHLSFLWISLLKPCQSGLILLMEIASSFVEFDAVTFQMSRLAFYFLGNTNKISTLDLSWGLSFFSSFNVMTTPALIYLISFAGPLMFLFKLNKKVKLLSLMWFAFIICNEMQFSAAILLIESNHLFLWSVFAPKVLVMACTTLLYLVYISFLDLFGKVK